MGLAQIQSGKLTRTSKRHGEKILLLEPLPVHNDIFKELADEIILQDFTVKQVDSHFHRLIATHALVQGDILQLETGVARL
jgi:hypothetical protein